MTACSTERGRRAARRLLLAAMLVGTAGAAGAQQVGPPKPLGPPLTLGPTVNPAISPPIAAPATPADATVDDALPAPARPTVTVNPLDAGGLDGAGPLDDGAGGLGPDLWRNSDRATIERVLPMVQLPENSLALRALARRLLLSAAVPPKGKGSGRSFIVERAETLAALGDYDGAGALLTMLPDKQVDATALRIKADTAWLADDAATACHIVEQGLSRFDRDAYLARAAIFCQAACRRWFSAIDCCIRQCATAPGPPGGQTSGTQ